MSKFDLKKVVLAVAMVGACAGANAAGTTTDLGPLTAGAPIPFSGSVIPGGPFVDVFTFILPANGGSGYSVINFPLDLGVAGTLNTVFTSLQLVSNPDGIVGTVDDTLLTSITEPGGVNTFSLTWGPSAGGSMYLGVTGLANGSLGGIYSGAINVAAVPEPSTWAMLGLGVGMIGFALRRKVR